MRAFIELCFEGRPFLTLFHLMELALVMLKDPSARRRNLKLNKNSSRVERVLHHTTQPYQ